MGKAVQLRLDLRTSADHYDWLAASQQRDMIAWTPSAEGRKWHALDLERARDQLSRWTGEPDIYLTPNEFNHWRLIKLGHGLNALYVDIDAHGEAEPDLMRMAATAIGRVDAMALPSPNFIVYTGRGIHLYWLIHRVPFAALPRWQACQRVLVKALQGDKMSADATRVLRVIGTVNSKTKSVVKAEMLNPQRYDFDWLCDQILPVERAKLRDLRAERARRGGELASAPRRIVGTIYDRWYLVYRDLCQICDYHWFGGVEAGQRDTMLHLMATSLSWFTQGDALEAEIQQTARRFMPSLTPQEVRSYTGSVLTRARHDADNEVGPAEWEWGKSRYRYKRETIYNLLESWIAPHPDLAEKLRAIVTDEVIRERKTEREKARKHAAGERKQTRDAYLAPAQERRSQALALRAEGLSVRKIAERLAVSVSTVSSYLKDAPEPKTGVFGVGVLE